MTTTSKTGQPRNDLLGLVSAEVREALGHSIAILDEAAKLRSTTWRHEDPVSSWEARVRLEAPKGRRWKALFSEAMDEVAQASSLLVKIFHRERKSLPYLRAAIAKLRVLASGDERQLPPHTLENLEDCARLRMESLDVMESALKLSEQIVTLRPKTPQDDVFTLLDERRRLLGESTSLKREADNAERRAFQPMEEILPDLDEAADLAVEEDEERGGNGTVATFGPTEDGTAETADDSLVDEEWETWLKAARAEAGDPTAVAEEIVADDVEKDPVSEPEAEAEAEKVIEQEEPEMVKLTVDDPKTLFDVVPHDVIQPEADDMDDPRRNVLRHRIRSLETELKSILDTAEAQVVEEAEKQERVLTEKLRKSESEAADRERVHEAELAKAEKKLGDLAKRLADAEQERDEAANRIETIEKDLSQERKARETVEKKTAELEAELGDVSARAQAAEEERDKAKNEKLATAKRLKAMREELKAEKATLEKQTQERLASQRKKAGNRLAAERKKAEERLSSRERELAEEREAELDDLRKTLGETMDAAIEDRKAAEQERDEALMLVTSLTRRLSLAGLSSDAEDGEIGPISEEISQVRKALWCQEGELQSLRNLLLSWKEEMSSRVDEMGYLRSRLGTELIET